MNLLRRHFARLTVALIAAVSLLPSSFAQDPTAPDELIRRMSNEMFEALKADTTLHKGNPKRLLALMEEKVLPYSDFERTTQLAAGKYWREMSLSQKTDLTREFRQLLMFTYAGAAVKISDQKLVVRPFKSDPKDTDVTVRTYITQARGEPIQLDYRLEKSERGWRVYDVNVMGVWLVENYKGSFATEISRSSIDGLIKQLADRNAMLAKAHERVGK